MQETFLCTQKKYSTNPVAHPIPNPRINAKYGCFERRSEEIGKEKKNGCNTSQVERQSLVANRQPPMSLMDGGEGMEIRLTEDRRIEESSRMSLVMPAI
jgi:hypothetical protein